MNKLYSSQASDLWSAWLSTEICQYHSAVYKRGEYLIHKIYSLFPSDSVYNGFAR